MAHLYKSIQIFPTLRLRAHVKVEGSIDPTIESASCSKVQIHFLSPNGPFDTGSVAKAFKLELVGGFNPFEK